jgi:dTDP-glucose pyrophosphorylase
LEVITLGRGFAWLDTGTVETLSEASDYIKTIETRQGLMIAALEEIAYTYEWIDKETLLSAASRYGKISLRHTS